MRIVLLLLVVLQLVGCAALTPPSIDTKLDQNGGYWFSYDATRRGTVLVPGDKNYYSCSEPAPDVMLGLVSSIDAKLKDATIDANVKGQLATSALQLATRTQMVSFLRESLYRLCELNLNSHLTKDDIRSLYASVIDVAAKIALAEVSQAEKNAEQEKTKAAEAQQKAAEAQKVAEEEKKKAAEAQKLAEQERAKAAEVVKQAEQEKLKATQAQQKLEDTKSAAPK